MGVQKRPKLYRGALASGVEYCYYRRPSTAQKRLLKRGKITATDEDAGKRQKKSVVRKAKLG
jgi:hypothetical protein